MSLQPLLATGMSADALPLSFYISSFCFALSGLCVLISGGIKLFAEQKHRLGLSVALFGFVLGLVEFSFAWQYRGIDLAPMADPGSTGSPSLMKSLFVPFVPVLMNGLLLLAHFRAGRSKA
jgi:hypothetical protein